MGSMVRFSQSCILWTGADWRWSNFCASCQSLDYPFPKAGKWLLSIWKVNTIATGAPLNFMRLGSMLVFHQSHFSSTGAAWRWPNLSASCQISESPFAQVHHVTSVYMWVLSPRWLPFLQRLPDPIYRGCLIHSNFASFHWNHLRIFFRS